MGSEMCIRDSYLKKPVDFGRGFRPNESEWEEKSYGSLVEHNERSTMPSGKNFAFFTPQNVSFTPKFP